MFSRCLSVCAIFVKEMFEECFEEFSWKFAQMSTLIQGWTDKILNVRGQDHCSLMFISCLWTPYLDPPLLFHCLVTVCIVEIYNCQAVVLVHLYFVSILLCPLRKRHQLCSGGTVPGVFGDAAGCGPHPGSHYRWQSSGQCGAPLKNCTCYRWVKPPKWCR